MAVKAKDIARMLGVSTATVSLVLNNKKGVSERRRREIIQKIREMHCEYLLDKHSLDNGFVGFVVYKREGNIVTESPFFTYVLEGLINRLNQYGYALRLFYIDKSMSKSEQESRIRSGEYKGLIIFAVEMYDDDLTLFRNIGLPFVTLDNSFREYDVDSVSINNIQGIDIALSYLYKMGHREIGYIRSTLRINSFDERYEAFRRKLGSLGLALSDDYIINVRYSEKFLEEDVRQYLANHKRLPSVFFAENDVIACNAIRSFEASGLEIPEDISLVGFDNRTISTLVDPQLTTINVPKDAFGPPAVDLLLSRLNQERTESLKVEIGTNLLERGSVKKLTI